MSNVTAGHDGSPNGVEMAEHPTAQKLAARSLEFLREVKDLYVIHSSVVVVDLYGSD